MNKRVVVNVGNKTAAASSGAAVLSSGIVAFKFLSWKELKEFKPHPHNWKIHPQGQKNAVNAAIEVVGYAGAILVNETTGFILDGHMRAKEAVQAKHDRIPVLFGRWSADEELVVLQSFDTIGAAFQIDASAFDSLAKVVANQGKRIADLLKNDSQKTALQRVSQGTSALAKKLLRSETEDGEQYQPLPFSLPKPSRTRPLTENIREVGQDDDSQAIEQEEEALEGVDDEGQEEESGEEEQSALGEEDRSGDRSSIYTEVRLRSDVLFDPSPVFSAADESYCLYGTPALHPDVDSADRYVQPENGPSDTVWDRTDRTMTESSIFCFSSGPNFPPERQGGFLSFHTEDHRFVGAWNNVVNFTKRLEEQGWAGVFEPEFSVTSELPGAVNVHNLYRSRYLARYWQDYFIPIIPLLRSSGWFESVGLDPLYPCQLIVPGTPVVGCQARNMRKDEIASKMAVLRSMFEYAVDHIETRMIVVYGGKDYWKYLRGNLYKADQVEYVLTPSFMASRRERIG